MLPINGSALGPGGYGSPDLLREPRDMRYFESATRATAALTGMAKWESISVLLGMTMGVVYRRETTDGLRCIHIYRKHLR